MSEGRIDTKERTKDLLARLDRWVGISGAATLLAWTGGWWIRGTRDPAIGRLRSVLWALSVAAGAWFAWHVAHNALGAMSRGHPTPGSRWGQAPALLGPTLRSPDMVGLAVSVGLLTAATVLATSVPLRRSVLLGFGAVGVFGYLVWAIAQYFGDTLGTPLVLLFAGLILAGVALVTVRLRPFAAEGQQGS